MRFLLRVVFVVLVAAAASRAETVRVAVAKGSFLEFSGQDLVARSSPDGPAMAMGAVSRMEAVGPFVSNGDALAPAMAIEDRSGGPVHVGGVCLLGAAEVVACDAGLLAVDHVDLETYVASVVGSEMSASWPAAALEAQAIAARTYVLKKKLAVLPGAAFDVEATVLHQVYQGAKSLDPRTVAAAAKTRGVVLQWAGQLADAFFFASCRGSTESAEAAFGTGAPYLVPTTCSGGEAAPNARWTRRLAVAKVSELLRRQGAIGDDLARIDVVSRTGTGRIASARLVTRRGGRTVTGAELRRLIGYTELPSLDAVVELARGDIVFTGAGAGHGVGLCQWCARGRALAGDGAEAILARAYPGTVLKTIY